MNLDRIRKIIQSDMKKLTGSVVARILIMGLCIVPCLYAWFNILSNWSPYEPEATGNIPVAVVSEDSGADLLGIDLNIGSKVVDALQKNDAMGWDFVESQDEAVEGVKSGKYYAAMVIPEDFTISALSFSEGKLVNPQIIYYENEKKNAIAPKITGKAKTAVQEQVNTTFVTTVAEYVGDAATVAKTKGINPGDMFSDLSERLAILSERLDTAVVMLDAADGLSSASDNLLMASNQLIEDAQGTLKYSESLSKKIQNSLPGKNKAEKAAKTAARLKQESRQTATGLDTLKSDLEGISSDKEKFNAFVKNKRDKKIAAVTKMRKASDDAASALKKLGLNSLSSRFSNLSAKLKSTETRLNKLETATEATWASQKTLVDSILKDIDDAKGILKTIDSDISIKDLEKKLNSAIADSHSAVKELRTLLNDSYGSLGSLSSILAGYDKSLGSLQKGLDSTEYSLNSMQGSMGLLSAAFGKLSGSNMMLDLNKLVSGDPEKLAEFLAEPVKMKTEIIYPAREYGSQMAAFYTVLAQWVGALLSTVLIKTRIKNTEELDNPTLVERFFGRYALFMFVGVAQGLIVSLGNLLYVGIQCTAPMRFILAACVNGVVFTMINYALVFALENLGQGLAVIILVLQVAGAGGTFPVEVIPPVLRVMNPFMPFRFAMNAMKECILGMYGLEYWKCILVLLLFGIISIPVGLLLYPPAQKLVGIINESKKDTGVMI